MNIFENVIYCRIFFFSRKVERIYNLRNLSTFLHMKFFSNKIGMNTGHSLEQSQHPDSELYTASVYSQWQRDSKLEYHVRINQFS